MANIWIIEDDKIMSECLALAVNSSLPSRESDVQPEHKIETFTNAVDALNALSQTVPDLILLDVLLSGPDGFSFLNELISYPDTANIPIIIITSLDLSTRDLGDYHVVQIFQKDTMTPSALAEVIKENLAHA